MSKGKCTFTASLQSKYPFIKKRTESDVRCEKCKCDFNIAKGGGNDIFKHLGTKRHKSADASASSSRVLTSFFKSSTPSSADLEVAAAAEGRSTDLEVAAAAEGSSTGLEVAAAAEGGLSTHRTKVQSMTGRQLEVCVDSLDSAIAAAEGGADRLELCMALSEGGLTPTPGLVSVVKKHISKHVDVFCLVRPRGGPMVYSEGEAEVILHDVETLMRAGADGLVFGALDSNGTVDKMLCKRFLEAVGGLPCTFHRAFDLLQDSSNGLETIIELGFQRILTSGGKATALEGCDNLAQLVTAAKGRIIIMAGAGIKSNNVTNIISLTGVTQCHASAKVCRVFGTEEVGGARMGNGSDNVLWVASSEEVQAIKRAMMIN